MSKSPDDEIYELGVVDGYAKAMQEVDVRSGGDGEYRFAMGGPSDRHCPDAEAMRDRIEARFDDQIETLKFIAPGLLVLRNMCARAGLKLGAAKAQEMINAVRGVLCDDASNPAAERTKADSQALNANEQPHQSKIPTQPQGEGDRS